MAIPSSTPPSSRREQIAQLLQESDQPVSASTLASKFQVSRQAIVGDIALLRASGSPIFATPRGYLLKSSDSSNLYTIACCHRTEDLAEELYTIIDLGGALLDVIVEHPVYGQIAGQLHLYSRFDVDAFLHKVESQKAVPLSGLTNGIHLHTIRCKDRDTYERILVELKKKGFLLDK